MPFTILFVNSFGLFHTRFQIFSSRFWLCLPLPLTLCCLLPRPPLSSSPFSITFFSQVIPERLSRRQSSATRSFSSFRHSRCCRRRFQLFEVSSSFSNILFLELLLKTIAVGWKVKAEWLLVRSYSAARLFATLVSARFLIYMERLCRDALCKWEDVLLV